MLIAGWKLGISLFVWGWLLDEDPRDEGNRMETLSLCDSLPLNSGGKRILSRSKEREQVPVDVALERVRGLIN